MQSQYDVSVFQAVPPYFLKYVNLLLFICKAAHIFALFLELSMQLMYFYTYTCTNYMLKVVSSLAVFL